MQQLHLWPWRVRRVPCPVCGKRTPADKMIHTWTTQALRMREAGAQNILPFWTGCHRCWLNWHNSMSSNARNTYNRLALQIGQHVGARMTLARLQDIEEDQRRYGD